jgi:hypothetical protein
MDEVYVDQIKLMSIVLLLIFKKINIVFHGRFIRFDSKEPNPCESMRIRIRILVRHSRHKKLGFDMKNLVFVGNTS